MAEPTYWGLTTVDDDEARRAYALHVASSVTADPEACAAAAALFEIFLRGPAARDNVKPLRPVT